MQYLYLCSDILFSKYAIDSLVCTGQTTRSTISFKSSIICQAGSSSGISSPTISAISLNKHQFSCEFPPMFFFHFGKHVVINEGGSFYLPTCMGKPESVHLNDQK